MTCPRTRCSRPVNQHVLHPASGWEISSPRWACSDGSLSCRLRSSVIPPLEPVECTRSDRNAVATIGALLLACICCGAPGSFFSRSRNPVRRRRGAAGRRCPQIEPRGWPCDDVNLEDQPRRGSWTRISPDRQGSTASISVRPNSGGTRATRKAAAPDLCDPHAARPVPHPTADSVCHSRNAPTSSTERSRVPARSGSRTRKGAPAGRIPDFPVTRSHPPASWPSAANSSICRTYRKTAGEESRRRSPVANRWMRP